MNRITIQRVLRLAIPVICVSCFLCMQVYQPLPRKLIAGNYPVLLSADTPPPSPKHLPDGTSTLVSLGVWEAQRAIGDLGNPTAADQPAQSLSSVLDRDSTTETEIQELGFPPEKRTGQRAGADTRIDETPVERVTDSIQPQADVMFDTFSVDHPQREQNEPLRLRIVDATPLSSGTEDTRSEPGKEPRFVERRVRSRNPTPRVPTPQMLAPIPVRNSSDRAEGRESGFRLEARPEQREEGGSNDVEWAVDLVFHSLDPQSPVIFAAFEVDPQQPGRLETLRIDPTDAASFPDLDSSGDDGSGSSENRAGKAVVSSLEATPAQPRVTESNSEQSPVAPLFDSLVSREQITPALDSIEASPLYPDEWIDGEWIDGIEHAAECDDGWFGRCSPWYRLFHLGIRRLTDDAGIGQERVMFAPFTVDHSQPGNSYRMRFDLVHGIRSPDVAEFFWAKPGSGPKFAERRVDYQDIRFQVEGGGKLFGMFGDFPFRILDPEINDDTAGFGDIVIGNRAVLIDGKFWQLAQVMRTYINTGSPERGLGTGHTSIEPGLVIRYKWTPKTYLHGEFKYFIPLGADPISAGAILNYGFSIATVLYETDTFAVLPTFEVTGSSILDGQVTVPLPAGGVVDPTRPVLGQPPFIGQPVDIDGIAFGTVQGGVRFVIGPRGDLGLLELGISSAVSTANNAFFNHRTQIDVRWSY